MFQGLLYFFKIKGMILKNQNDFITLGAGALLPATPIAFLGTYDDASKPNIMAVAWFGIVNSLPPIMSVSVRKERKSYQNIVQNKSFTLSIPSEEQAQALDFTGIVSGNTQDKFNLLEYSALEAEHVHAPYVGECPFIVELSLRSFEDLGSHICFLGEVIDIKVRKEFFDAYSNFKADRIKPLVYSPILKEYKALGENKGRAFSLGRAYNLNDKSGS